MNKYLITKKIRFNKGTTQEYRKKYLIDLAIIEMNINKCLGNPFMTTDQHKEKLVIDNLVTLNTKTLNGKIEFYKITE